jgi:hypothetical protein
VKLLFFFCIVTVILIFVTAVVVVKSVPTLADVGTKDLGARRRSC